MARNMAKELRKWTRTNIKEISLRIVNMEKECKYLSPLLKNKDKFKGIYKIFNVFLKSKAKISKFKRWRKRRFVNIDRKWLWNSWWNKTILVPKYNSLFKELSFSIPLLFWKEHIVNILLSNTLETFTLGKWKVLGSMFGPLGRPTKGNGLIIGSMEKVSSIGLMDLTFKELMLMMNVMVKELWFGVWLKDTEGIGPLDFAMDMVNL